MISADDINREHQLAHQHAKTAIEHAVRCGELLAGKKAELPHGSFQPWLKEHCQFAYSTAARYMKAVKQISTGVEISTLSQIFASGRKEGSGSTQGALANPPELSAEENSSDGIGDRPDEASETLASEESSSIAVDPYFRQEWVDRIPMESGMVTLCVEAPVLLVESKLSPGYWHDIDLRDGTSSVRPCKPNGLRWRLMRDSGTADCTWSTHPDSGDWLEGESEYWKQRIPDSSTHGVAE